MLTNGMKQISNIATWGLIVWATVSFAQAQLPFDFSGDAVIERLTSDVYTLASEEMEGREAGTPGERKAAAYIRERMIEAGLEPLFGESFYQDFPFPGEWVWGDDNLLVYGDHTFEHGVDYYAMPGSSSGRVEAEFVHVGHGLTGLDDVEGFAGHCDYALHDDVEGRIFVMEFYFPEPLDTVPDRQAFRLWFQKLQAAVERGAAGIIFVNTLSGRDDPPMDLRLSRLSLDIPLLFAEPHVLKALMADQGHLVHLTVDIERTENTGRNVAGYIDNGAGTTVVVGAHYDHVGYGAQGSLSPGVHAIHPGADDNASGTAGMLEAARYVSHSTLDNHNYLFIAFSAEEKGLIGSRYFTNSDAYDMDRINYMFNLDMIGRMAENTLTLIGTGTSPLWEDLIDEHAPGHFNIRKSPGGRGGSDHTSFYVKDIPVLFFFTGVHEDYHRPGDTADKINYEGAYEITRFALSMMETLDGRQRLAFTSASGAAPGRTRSDTPTLGLMPDHGYDGEGLRVLSVTDDRPAQKAGIENGDVIVRINDLPVLEIQSYMEALGAMEGGDVVRVVVRRGDEEHAIDVQL